MISKEGVGAGAGPVIALAMGEKGLARLLLAPKFEGFP